MYSLYIPNSIKVVLAIGHWLLGHTEQCNSLLESIQNNRFPVPNYQCPRQPESAISL